MRFPLILLRVQALLLVEKNQVPAPHNSFTSSRNLQLSVPLLQRAKEAYIVPTLPWLRAAYLHREQQSRFLHEVALAALHAATSARREGYEAMLEAEAAVLVTANAGQAHRYNGSTTA